MEDKQRGMKSASSDGEYEGKGLLRHGGGEEGEREGVDTRPG